MAAETQEQPAGMFVREAAGQYRVDGVVSKDDIIDLAKKLTKRSMQRGTLALTSPNKVRDYLQLHFSVKWNEEFWCLFLDTKHRVLAHEVLFTGTINSTSVYPRVVVERVLHHKAAAVIFAHNHPSGDATPSAADHNLVKKLQTVLEVIDVRILDSMIVGANEIWSMEECGGLQ